MNDRFSRLLLLVGAVFASNAAGCSYWRPNPAVVQQWSDLKENVQAIGPTGESTGLDRRARDIEKNLGVYP